MTGHIWDGYFTLGNMRALKGLPDDLRQILQSNLNKAAADERDDVRRKTDTVRAALAQTGMTFVEPDRESFRVALKRAGFYAETRAKFGNEAWSMLESTV